MKKREVFKSFTQPRIDLIFTNSPDIGSDSIEIQIQGQEYADKIVEDAIRNKEDYTDVDDHMNTHRIDNTTQLKGQTLDHEIKLRRCNLYHSFMEYFKFNKEKKHEELEEELIYIIYFLRLNKKNSELAKLWEKDEEKLNNEILHIVANDFAVALSDYTHWNKNKLKQR